MQTGLQKVEPGPSPVAALDSPSFVSRVRELIAEIKGTGYGLEITQRIKREYVVPKKKK